jgi:hypothetical protein
MSAPTEFQENLQPQRSTFKRKRGLWLMPLIQVVLLLIIVGVVLWLINQYVPMAVSIRSILNAVVVIAVIVWLLNVFGLLSANPRLHIG